RFGGHVKSGQSVIKTLLSEAKEEVCLSINKKKILNGPCRKRNNYPNCEYTYTFFYLFAGDIKKLKFKDSEVQKVKWMESDDIKKQLSFNHKNWSGSLKGFKLMVGFLKTKEKSRAGKA
ncbi:NUDIX domain-containing protein, partial [Candidatus Parcubacteria bacterium]